jgi:glycosyltransferase involved in cell wall biosynthesis
VLEPELVGWLANEGTMETRFLGEIAASASPMIVHSQVTARYVEQRHGVVPRHLPFSIHRRWKAEELTARCRSAARTRLGLTDGEVVIATFGFVDAVKAPEECVWALEQLCAWGVNASLHFVGQNDPAENGRLLLALIKRLGLTEKVRFWPSNFVPEDVYRDYLAGADLGIQLRNYGLGGLSGALLDCAAAGLPTVTNAALAEAVGVPSGYVRTIPDEISPVLLAEALASLLEAGVTTSLLEAERAAFAAGRSFGIYARRLCAALSLDIPGAQP